MIETKRLKIRHIQGSDIHDVFEYAVDEDTGPRAGWPPHKTIEDTKSIMNMWLDPSCTEEVFGLVHKQDGKVIGTMGIVRLNNHMKDEKNFIAKELVNDGKIIYEIGITLSKKYWNQGLVTEALSAIIDYLFEVENADVVMATHYEANIASMRVQEKNNLRVLGQYERDEAWYNTDCKTMIVRAKNRNEWIAENN